MTKMTKPTSSSSIKSGALPLIAQTLNAAAKYAYAATWVDGDAREHLIRLMNEELATAKRLAGDGVPLADDTRCL